MVFNQLERGYNLHFYYPENSLPDRNFNEKFEKTPLPILLKQLFRTTNLDYFFYRNYAVAVAPASKLEGEFSAGFYKALADLSESKNAVASPENSAAVAEMLRVGSPENVNASGKCRVKIRVFDAQNGQTIIGAAVVWKGLPDRTEVTDRDGKAEVVLPVGRQSARIQYIGYQLFESEIQVLNDGDLTLKMTMKSTDLAEVLIRPDAADANVASTKIGLTKISTVALKKLPTLMGEADVVRGILTTTGVTSVGEGAAGFNVRGGEIDQNLMLQDEMVLFNSSHALGFFSTYNTDLVSNIELYKSIIPAQFGGRLASVLDVGTRDGNAQKWITKGGLSLVSGRLSIEGPIIKNTSSLLTGIRISYSDWLLKLMKRLELKRSKASFYDINARYTHRLNADNVITVSVYAAADKFNYANQFGFDYQTRGGQLTWKRIIHDKLFSRFSVVASQYESTQTDFDGADGGLLKNGINYYKARELLTWNPRRTIQVLSGFESTLYHVTPGIQQPVGPVSAVKSKSLEKEHGLESAIFSQMDWTKTKKFTISTGLRLNLYQYLGGKTVFIYGDKISEKQIVDTLVYQNWKTIKTYFSPEPRLSFRYRIDKTSSFKGGYSRTSQFINQIFNTDSPTPTSQYQLSTDYIRPFRAHNLAAGYFKNSRNNEWEYAGELFYRLIDKLWDYRDFAHLTANEHIETEIRNGNGRAYGLEISVKTSRKRVNGQLGYTFSRTQRQVSGINNGQFYPSNFDKPHILNLIVNLLPSMRQNITFNFTYSTGRPTTSPLTSYRLQNNIIVPIYSPRNSVRIPDYHRLDVSWTIGKGYNKKHKLKTSWNLSVYNVYGRRNAFSVFHTQAPDLTTVANRLAIVGIPFPAITMNIETQ